MKIPLLRAALVTTAAALCLTGSASAVIVVTNTSNVAPAGTAGAVYDAAVSGTPLYSPSSTDLIQGMTPTVTYVGVAGGSVTNESSRGTAAWTDGSIATVYGGSGVSNAVAHNAYGTVSATTGNSARQVYVTYDLGSIYNLSAVNVYLGWNDSGRDDSSFIVLVSTDGTTFTNIASYTKPADNTGAITTPITNLHSVTDSLGGDIASGIRYVQVEFTDSDNGFAGMSELDVFGTAVPETSSAALAVLGGLLLARRKRN